MRKLIRWDMIAWLVLAIGTNIMVLIDDGPPWRAIQQGGPESLTVVAWLLAAYTVLYGYWIVNDKLGTPHPITRQQRRLWVVLAVLAVPLTLGLMLLATAMGIHTNPFQTLFPFAGLLLFTVSITQLFRPRAD